jgi:hypothetical protein
MEKNSILVWRGNRKKLDNTDEIKHEYMRVIGQLGISCVILLNQQHVCYLLLAIFYVIIRRLSHVWKYIRQKKRRLLSLSFTQSCWSPYNTIDPRCRVDLSIMRNKCTLTLTCDYRCSFTNEHRHTFNWKCYYLESKYMVIINE